MYAESKYRSYLNLIESEIGINETDSDQLTFVGKRYIGKNFIGCFPRDMIPKLKINQCCIVNEDIHTGPGFHWMALYRSKDGYLFNDSFGRPHKKIMKNLKNRLVFDADDTDREQKLKEMNCGQRCIAFLLTCYDLGFNLAKLI